MTLGRAGFTDPKPAEADLPEKADKAVAEAFSPTLALGGEDIICPSGLGRRAAFVTGIYVLSWPAT